MAPWSHSAMIPTGGAFPVESSLTRVLLCGVHPLNMALIGIFWLYAGTDSVYTTICCKINCGYKQQQLYNVAQKSGVSPIVDAKDGL